jgi:hypothetical protein
MKETKKYFKTLIGMYRYTWRILGRERGTKYAWKFAKFEGIGYSIPLSILKLKN